MTILVQNTWFRDGPVPFTSRNSPNLQERREQLHLSHLHAQDGRELGEVRVAGGRGRGGGGGSAGNASK